MRRINNCKGGITVFQCLIFIALLMLAGIIIDAVRITVAERRVQSALNTAVRSSLAAYDKDIVGDYGIFAFNTALGNEEDSKKFENIFKKYLQSNLGIGAKHREFIGYELDYGNTYIDSDGSLISGNPDILKNQILKYMKYKGPVTVTGNVIERLKASGIFQKAEFSAKEKKARNSGKNLKKDIEEINSYIMNVNETSSRISSLDGQEYIRALRDLKRILLNAEEESASIEDAYEEYEKAREDADTYAKEANKKEAIDQEGAKIQFSGNEFAGVLEESRKIHSDAQRHVKELESLVTSIEPLQNQVDELERQKSGLENANYYLYLRLSSLSQDKDQSEIQNLISSLEANNSAISSLQTEISSLRQSIWNLRSVVNYPQFKKISISEPEDDQREKPQGEVDWSKLDKLNSALERYIRNKNIHPEWLITQEEFQQANSPQNTEFGEILDGNARGKKVLDNEHDGDMAETENDSILNIMNILQNRVVNFFSEGGQASIEKMYIVEYIMDKFTYHTSKTDRNHYFEKGEVEYILWGSTNQNSNIGKTLSTIGVVRLAINAVDYFATSKVPHPVLRLVYAVGRGLVQSSIDTYDLYSGNEISVCPSLKDKKVTFNMNYSDHLRLFLLMQSVMNEKGQLNNIRQLIQVNIKQLESRENFRLGDYETRIAAQATVKIKLLFLPILQLDKLNVKGFSGGKYIVTRRAYTGF